MLGRTVKFGVSRQDSGLLDELCAMASCCWCCCCIILIGSLSLAVLVGGVILWLFTMGVQSNLLSITLTAGTLMILSLGFMVSTRIVVLLCGLLSLLFTLYF